MAALANHFRCKVLGGATVRHPLTVLVEEVRPAEVCKFNRFLRIKKNVLRLDVSVDDRRVHRVEILAGLDHLTDELGGNSFGESTFPLESRVDLALGCEFQDQIERVVVFIMVEELHDVLVIKLVHDLDLKFDLLDEVVLDNLGLVDDLDRVDVLGCLVAHFVHLAEAANADV